MEKFKMPKDLWLKFGCFLSGHNYQILSECSEASKRDQKKITSALIIISIIWATVGYIFAIKYLGGNITAGIIGSIFLTIIIIQIERQIILTKSIGWKIMASRFLLGLIVAMIGATVVDQYIFKQDIEKIKKDNIDLRIKNRIISDQVFNTKQTSRFDSIINTNSIRLNSLLNQLKKTPPMTTVVTKRDENGKPVEFASQPNPQFQFLQSQITTLQQENNNWAIQKNNSANNLNSTINQKKDASIKEDDGFLDELELMVDFLINYKKYGKSYPVALAFYTLWLLFFLLIELSILILKSSNESNDYEKIVEYQQKIREQRLMILEDKRNAALGSDQNIDATNSLITNIPK
jgi:hypothetical protein